MRLCLRVVPATSSTAAAAAEAVSEVVRGFGNFGSGVELEGAPFDCKGLCIDQSIGNLFVCRFENPSERLAGDFHLLGGLFLIETLKVCQADSFELIDRQRDMLQYR